MSLQDKCEILIHVKTTHKFIYFFWTNAENMNMRRLIAFLPVITFTPLSISSLYCNINESVVFYDAKGSERTIEEI